MRRLCLFLFGCAFVCLPARAGDDGTHRKISVQYLQKLQTEGGGFLPMNPKPGARQEPTLRATSAAVRALHYFGGKVPDAKAAARFVADHYDPKTGGFRDTAQGKPDVFITAVGLMAVAELGMPKEKYARAVEFLSANARGFEDVRIAVAGLEAVKAKAPKADEWLKEIGKLRNADGTYGKGDGQARDTGSAVVAVLRLGGEVENRENVLKVLKAGQRQDGGFGKEGADASDLETTYRVMRAFHMLKARPERVQDLLGYLERCRNINGGYGTGPGQTPTVGGTYYASIILHWLLKDEPKRP